MFSKLANIKKRNFLSVFIVYLALFLSTKLYANMVMKDIIRTFEESKELDKKIVKKICFKLLDEQLLKGSVEKYMFKSNIGKEWLFKTYSSPETVKTSKCIYHLSQLLGVSTPQLYEISMPINGKLVYGTIQEFIPKSISVKNISFDKLSKKQIMAIQKCQILDWLILDNDTTSDHFIIKPKSKELLVVDKDDSFRYIECNFFGDDPWNNSYYTKFWDAYTKGVIDISFQKTFDFINYVQGIDNEELKKILSTISEKEELIREFFLRKENLKSEFENFYRKLSVLRKEQFQLSAKSEKEECLKAVLKKLRETVFKKRRLFKKLESKIFVEQKNIAIVSSKSAWFAVRELNFCSRKEFVLDIKKTLERLKYLEKSTSNVYEKLAINLYIENVKKIWKQKDVIENFLQNEIKRITINSAQITKKKILNIEYNLRGLYGQNRHLFSEYEKEIAMNSIDVLIHLNYINRPVTDKFSKKEQGFLKMYKEKTKNKENNWLYKFIYGILLKDLNYLERLDDSFSWKHLGLGLIHSFNIEGERAVEECNKALFCKSESMSTFHAHMLLGFIYGHNYKWERFEKGSDVEKSIKSYKESLKINPKSVKAHLNLGILYLIQKKSEKVLREFKEVNRLNPQYGKEHFHFDKIKEKSVYKNKNKYLEAVRMNTLSGRHHYILGLAYLIKEDKETAQEHFDKVKEFGY